MVTDNAATGGAVGAVYVACTAEGGVTDPQSLASHETLHVIPRPPVSFRMDAFTSIDPPAGTVFAFADTVTLTGVL
jgi:hypothetical protein